MQNHLHIAKPLRPEWRGIAGLVALPHHPAKIPKMSGDIQSAKTLCLSVWCQAVPEADLFMQDWGLVPESRCDTNALVEASKRAFHNCMRA